MKGIVLAGGTGSRLFPVTEVVSKQLLPICDKPLVYYPLSVLMMAGIQEILLITTPKDISLYKKLLGTGEQFGLKLEYATQEKANGLAEAFIIGEKFIDNKPCCLILGDNLFYGDTLSPLLESVKKSQKPTIFGYYVKNPNAYGVIEFENNLNNNIKKVISIEEKPKKPKSNYAVIGLYFYDEHVSEYAKQVKPSNRGELEITDLNKIYLEKNNLQVELLGNGFAWLDTGTVESLMQASEFVHTIQERQGLRIACLEEIAYKKNWISLETLKKQAKKYSNSPYGEYLNSILNTQI